jgi:curved DNA-binding protein CbpA
MNDLYEALQVHPRAEPAVIRAAHRALARTYHPDMGGDERRMMDINSAWAILGDPILRAAYDIERDRSILSAATKSSADVDPRADRRTPHADAPPRTRSDSSRTMDFGRYAGWSLVQLAEHDPDYLEWLVRTSVGRGFTAEVEALLRPQRTASPPRAGSRPAKGESRWWNKKGGERRTAGTAARRPVRT